MTNTKFRKRALLSSVAMLLVALVALGSATFAWFTSRPDANATGLHMKATAAAGLVIQTQSARTNAASVTSPSVDADWWHDDFLNSNSDRSATLGATASGGMIQVAPASCAQTATPAFFTTTADKDTESTAKSTAVVDEATVTIISGSTTTIANAPIVTNFEVPARGETEVWWFIQNGDDSSMFTSTSNASYSHEGLFLAV